MILGRETRWLQLKCSNVIMSKKLMRSTQKLSVLLESSTFLAPFKYMPYNSTQVDLAEALKYAYSWSMLKEDLFKMR